ncbi:RagB/SusD family nutrient uptake outer membrane protein [Segetibacter koreensis]|uniref:RagB/SusD family nutrient uptake outer membrane protein n=1 Tax=Segetibacter koreensis TaxID=398037 RepID=UPI000524E49B|nr:RagB/SusD family nutrient uptake outer membrane protein [Segetibacter koreensis]
MKKNIILAALILVSLSSFFVSCKKDYGNLNNATVEDFLKNASKSDLNNLVSGTEAGMRNQLALYLDDVGVIGREGYRFSNAEPRYVTDLPGANNATLSNSNFYITNPWSARYRVVKNCNVLLQAAANSSLISEAKKKGYAGFARTIKAYQLLINLNLTDTNGIRVDVADPDNLGKFVTYNDGLAAIASLLDSAVNDLSGATVVFPLAGFNGFNDAAGLAKFNRALAARVAVYRQDWQGALTALSQSFFDLNKDFYLGVFHVFGTGSGDQLNPVFIPQNQTGEVRVAHPTYARDIEAGDDRINKATLRTTTASLSGLASNRDIWVYTSSTAPVPIVRNEELILIYAEANIQLNNFSEGIKAINTIRKGHQLANYTGAQTKAALINEMLKQRRYSLFYEGHRWIDMRRYDRLGELPVDRQGDDVWKAFPRPFTEQY